MKPRPKTVLVPTGWEVDAPSDTICPDVPVLADELPVEHCEIVVDDDRKLLGVITASQTRPVLTDPASFEHFIIAADVMEESGYPVAGPRDSLADVMKRLARYRGEIPVVADGRLIGVIWPEDVLTRYDAELLKRDMASGMVSSVSAGPRAAPVPIVKDASIEEMPVPGRFVGKSLGELDIRNRYDVTVLLVKQRVGGGEEVVNAVTDAEYVFQRDDVVLVMGPEDKLRSFRRGYAERE